MKNVKMYVCVSQELLDRLNNLAKSKSMTKSALIAQYVSEGVLMDEKKYSLFTEESIKKMLMTMNGNDKI